jgi:hypothetical protein
VLLGTPLAWLNARGRGVCPLRINSALRGVMASVMVDHPGFACGS